MNIARQYVEGVRDETNYSPTWLPNVKIEVGAVCRLHKFQYDQVTDLASKGIAFQVVSGPGADITYASTGVQSVAIGVSGGTYDLSAPAGVIQGSAKISFKSAGGIVFEITGCISTRIRDLEDIGKKILALHDVGKWDPDHVIITEVVSTQGAAILISNEDNASIDLGVSGNAVPALGNLAKLAGDLQVTANRSIGVKVIGNSLTPLFRASGVKRRVFGANAFRSAQDAGPDVTFSRMDYEDFAGDE